MLGLATTNGQPLFLDVGVHFVNNPTFTMDENPFRRQDEAYIKLGPVHIILVPKGKIVPLLVNGEGHFLLEGRHMINQVRPSARTPSIPPSVEPSSLPTLCC